MDLINFLEPIFLSYGWLIALLGGIFAGEEVIMTLSFFASKELIPLWVVFVFCSIGIFICDLFFFLIGRLRIVKNLSEVERIARMYGKLDKIISKLTKESTILALFYTKFIFGTRILTLIYLGIKRTKIKDFVLSIIIVIILWMSVVVSIGFFAGVAFFRILEIFKNLQLAIIFIVFLVVMLLIIKKWIGNKLTQGQRRLK